ncbi:uridine-cytidine kinase-like 1 isoform X3 [Cricetulus griseus]|uniref:Uridine-cytidine kinase n=1 Tax=Cricetulus griseus TaxID=10029 RepID=A0A9J7H359_CRIGR|nr:uridine-cytidine kinase-like 1 isoform X3 [Cricetulus griseus]XP_035312225.1 uridine-cytidine kinase-like 1 isoform X3 [Cricetulus griseus]
MAAPPVSADTSPSPLPSTVAPDVPGRPAEQSETACEDRSNAGSLDRLLPPVGTGRSPRKRTTSQCKSEPPLLRTSKRTIYTAGRPPWYNEHGTQSKEAFAIGLGGGSASGKTTVARMIIEALDVPWVVLLSMDSFYKVLTQQQQEQAACNNFNFDHPDAFDFDLIISTLKKLKQGRSVQIPIYDFTTHSRKKDWKTLYGANVIIFEGIMAFADKTLLELLDMKIFVDTDSDIRLVRRLRRDISERGRDIEGVIKQYNKFVKPAFEQYIQPTMRLADIVVPRGSGNTVAIDLIVQHVHSQLEERELSVRAALASAHQCHPLPQTLSVLKSTPQVRGMHTIIRDKETSRDEFIFYSKRLMRLLIEHALSFLPFQIPQFTMQDCTVQTPQGQDYVGKCYAGKQITGVSILRAGETMEPALRAVCKDVRIGTILIQTNQLTGEPELHYLRLPKDISDDHVILMDCTVSTGAAAMMAVRVLLDKIFLLSLLMAEMGVHSVAYAFPRVRIITTAVDKRVNDLFRIIPGIGNFGDRYFGTDAVPDGSDEEETASMG